MIDVTFLSSMDLFSGVQQELLEPIVDQSSVQSLQRGDMLFTKVTKQTTYTLFLKVELQ